MPVLPGSPSLIPTQSIPVYNAIQADPKETETGSRVAHMKARIIVRKSDVFIKEGEEENGAGDGSRTRDIELGKLAFYPLNYSRSFSKIAYQQPNSRSKLIFLSPTVKSTNGD